MLELDMGAKINPCPGLLLERDPHLGLGIRCYKDRGHFHPLEALLRRVVEEGLTGPEQLEAIHITVSRKSRIT